jgi:hypothetical protein
MKIKKFGAMMKIINIKNKQQWSGGADGVVV